jgi:transcription initiation factor TFIIIB Brf1 subunit/transcription initiation factor TFIIB
MEGMMREQLTDAQKDAMHQERICPKCGKPEMRPTYEPYELRCWDCGFWWDDYTGKEVHIKWEDDDES